MIAIALLITHCIAFLYLFAGSISDIKTREVADWANYGLITIGIAINLIFTLVLGDWNFFLNSIFGFAVFFGLALLMFYTGQWGGGDSKMLMGLGALYGLGLSWAASSFLINFIVNTLLAGAIYGIIWSISLAFIHKEEFIKAFKKILTQKYVKLSRIALLIVVAAGFVVFFVVSNLFARVFYISFSILAFLTLYLWALIKAVEQSCMHKYISPDKLTEGDWIAEEVKIGGKYITGPKELGITKPQLKILQKLYREKKIKKVLVKEGIPFVPSFFLGWIMTLVLGNIFALML